MRKGRILFIAGIWVAVLPYLGIPHLWKNILFSLSGLGLAIWGYLWYKEIGGKGETPDNFTENGHN